MTVNQLIASLQRHVEKGGDRGDWPVTVEFVSDDGEEYVTGWVSSAMACHDHLPGTDFEETGFVMKLDVQEKKP